MQRHTGAAGVCEDDLHAVIDQRLDDDIGSGDKLGSGSSFLGGCHGRTSGASGMVKKPYGQTN
jgi:hypothetical protein